MRKQPAKPGEFKDKVGNLLKPGDLIVYGHAMGRCAGLRYGKVLFIGVSKAWRMPEGTGTNLRVQGVDDDWDSQPLKLARPGTLQFPERVLRVNEEQIPPAIYDLLKTIKVAAMSDGNWDE